VGGELEGVVDLFQLTVPFGQFCPYHTTTAPYNALLRLYLVYLQCQTPIRNGSYRCKLLQLVADDSAAFPRLGRFVFLSGFPKPDYFLLT